MSKRPRRVLAQSTISASTEQVKSVFTLVPRLPTRDMARSAAWSAAQRTAADVQSRQYYVLPRGLRERSLSRSCFFVAGAFRAVATKERRVEKPRAAYFIPLFLDARAYPHPLGSMGQGQFREFFVKLVPPAYVSLLELDLEPAICITCTGRASMAKKRNYNCGAKQIGLVHYKQ